MNSRVGNGFFFLVTSRPGLPRRENAGAPATAAARGVQTRRAGALLSRGVTLKKKTLADTESILGPRHWFFSPSCVALRISVRVVIEFSLSLTRNEGISATDNNAPIGRWPVNVVRNGNGFVVAFADAAGGLSPLRRCGRGPQQLGSSLSKTQSNWGKKRPA